MERSLHEISGLGLALRGVDDGPVCESWEEGGQKNAASAAHELLGGRPTHVRTLARADQAPRAELDARQAQSREQQAQ